jgi:hypothetical protein
MLAQYANSLNNLLTSSNPGVRWYIGGHLGTKIIFDLTTGSFLTGIETDLKNLGSDAEKLTKAFKGDWSSGFNESARLGIQETPPTSGGSDPHKLSLPPHERTQNALTGKLDEASQLKLTDNSGVIKGILNQIIDKNNGGYLGGLNEGILKSFIGKLPDPSTPSGKNIFFEIKNALEVDVPGSDPPIKKIDPTRAENFIKYFDGNAAFVALIGADKVYDKGWSLFFDQPCARKNPDILTAFKEWPSLTGGSAISFTKDTDHIKILKGPEVIGIVKNDVLLATQFDSRLYKIPPVGISAIGPKINSLELYSVNGSRVLKWVPDITGIDIDNVSLLMGDGKHTLERHGPDIPKETIKYRAQTGIAPDGFGNSNTFTANYASQFETPTQVNDALNKVGIGSPAYTAALSLVGATDLTMTVEYKSGVNNNPHQVFGIGYPNQLLSPPQPFVETPMTNVKAVKTGEK